MLTCIYSSLHDDISTSRVPCICRCMVLSQWILLKVVINLDDVKGCEDFEGDDDDALKELPMSLVFESINLILCMTSL